VTLLGRTLENAVLRRFDAERECGQLISLEIETQDLQDAER
jgi:hypothetical protein